MMDAIIGLFLGYILGVISGAFCVGLAAVNDPGEDEEGK